MPRILNIRGGLGNQAIQISYMDMKYGMDYNINDPNDVLHVSFRERRIVKNSIVWYFSAGIRKIIKKKNWPGVFKIFGMVDGYCQNEVFYYSERVMADLTSYFIAKERIRTEECVIHARLGDYLSIAASALYVPFKSIWPKVQVLVSNLEIKSPIFISQASQSEIENYIGFQNYSLKSTSNLEDDIAIALKANIFIGCNSTLSLLISELRTQLNKQSYSPKDWYNEDQHPRPVLANKHMKY